MIVEVTEENLPDAGTVHAVSWRESHRAFCSPEFIAKNTPEKHALELGEAMRRGEKTWLLMEAEKPVGVVSVEDDLIENLYILPDMQNCGRGSKLLQFAMAQCTGTPTLWILNVNNGAYRLYRRFGFRKTGNRHQLSDTIFEVEMRLKSLPSGQNNSGIHV